MHNLHPFSLVFKTTDVDFNYWPGCMGNPPVTHLAPYIHWKCHP